MDFKHPALRGIGAGLLAAENALTCLQSLHYEASIAKEPTLNKLLTPNSQTQIYLQASIGTLRGPAYKKTYANIIITTV